MYYFPEEFCGIVNRPSKDWIISGQAFINPDGRKLTVPYFDGWMRSYGSCVTGNVITAHARVAIDEYTKAPTVLVEGTPCWHLAEKLEQGMKSPFPISELIPGNHYRLMDGSTMTWVGVRYRKVFVVANNTLNISNDRLACYGRRGRYLSAVPVDSVKAVFHYGNLYPGVTPVPYREKKMLSRPILSEDVLPDDFEIIAVPHRTSAVNMMIFDGQPCVNEPSTDKWYMLDRSLTYLRTITAPAKENVKLFISIGDHRSAIDPKILLQYCQAQAKER